MTTFPGPVQPDQTLSLVNQLERIRDLMLDGKWRTLSQIAAITGDSPASISAQLRHLRKEQFGSFIVKKSYLGNGLWEYQVIAQYDAALRASA